MNSNNTSLVAVEQHLMRCGSRWSPQSKRWKCPAHRDFGFSLSVRVDFDGSIRLQCTRGCPVARILTATGLTWFDLTPAELVATMEASA